MYQFSIIIPVFNAEKYLTECLASLNLSYHEDVQVILINDGSSDQSASICMGYKNRYPKQVVYIEKNNNGVSAARNDGIAVADGKYLVFVDADDYVADNYLLCLKEITSVPAELYIYNYKIFNNNGFVKRNIVYQDGKYKLDAAFCVSIFDTLEYQLWNKVFLKSIIEEKHIRFNKDMKWCEDLDFWVRYVLAIDDIYIRNYELYNYRLNEKGAVASVNIEAFDDYHIAFQNQLKLLDYKHATHEAYVYLMQSYIELVGLLVYRCYRKRISLCQLKKTLKKCNIINDMTYGTVSFSANFKKICLKNGLLRVLMMYYIIRKA